MGADVLGVAIVDMLPDVFHVGDFGGVIKVAEKFLLEIVGSGAGEDAGDVRQGEEALSVRMVQVGFLSVAAGEDKGAEERRGESECFHICIQFGLLQIDEHLSV